jgi:hypothetical protein
MLLFVHVSKTPVENAALRNLTAEIAESAEKTK